MLNALLLLAVGLPLLLAFPVLRMRVPYPCHFALLPAVILVVTPEVFSIEGFWLLFGAGLGICELSELLLAMSVVFWAITATLLHTSTGKAVGNHRATFFLLTMAGNLGMILSTDLVGFFTFSALMGYGFYALLVVGGDEARRRAGRVYLSLMILADLALFEALIIAAVTTDDLSFVAVRQAMAQSPFSDLYLSMVLLGFAARAGVWPLHFWLRLIYRSSQPMVALLLGGVPVATGLLGAVRWLPLGEITSPDLGMIIQGMGVTAMFYAILAGLIRAQWQMLPVYAVITATGLLTIVIGTGLSDPDLWNRYGHFAYFFIASLGIGFAVLGIATRWLVARQYFSATPAMQADDLNPWFERWPGAVVHWGRWMGFDILPRLRTSMRVKAGYFRQVRTWQKTLDASERLMRRWSFAITLLLLLCTVVMFISASF